MTRFIQIQTTIDSREIAEQLGRRLVGLRLVACVHILGPVTSFYHWEGEMASTEEWVCCLKTRSDLFDQIAQQIQQEHPYELPEIIAIPIEQGSEAYLNWLDQQIVMP